MQMSGGLDLWALSPCVLFEQNEGGFCGEGEGGASRLLVTSCPAGVASTMGL